jgi:hypothetical protein
MYDAEGCPVYAQTEYTMAALICISEQAVQDSAESEAVTYFNGHAEQVK